MESDFYKNRSMNPELEKSKVEKRLNGLLNSREKRVFSANELVEFFELSPSDVITELRKYVEIEQQGVGVYKFGQLLHAEPAHEPKRVYKLEQALNYFINNPTSILSAQDLSTFLNCSPTQALGYLHSLRAKGQIIDDDNIVQGRERERFYKLNPNRYKIGK